MLLFFFIIALIAMFILLVHITIKLNKIDKAMENVVDRIRKHYES